LRVASHLRVAFAPACSLAQIKGLWHAENSGVPEKMEGDCHWSQKLVFVSARHGSCLQICHIQKWFSRFEEQRLSLSEQHHTMASTETGKATGLDNPDVPVTRKRFIPLGMLVH